MIGCLSKKEETKQLKRFVKKQTSHLGIFKIIFATRKIIDSIVP
jgi:hypothetical protein